MLTRSTKRTTEKSVHEVAAKGSLRECPPGNWELIDQWLDQADQQLSPTDEYQ